MEGGGTQLTSSGSQTYSYDAAGNRTSAGAVTGPDNQLTSDGTWNYAYDAAGNQVGKTSIATGETWSFTYDVAGHQTSAVHKDGSGNVLLSATYTFDVFGNRFSTSVTTALGTTVTKFSYENAMSGQGNVYADFDAAGNLEYRRVFLDGTDQVAARVSAAGTVSWYLTDHLGSVRAITDGNGTVQDEIGYDAFGNIVSESNPAYGDRYKYTAREYDAEIGLYYYRARMYDAATGRFDGVDPAQADQNNTYRYVGNGPTGATDPSGNWLVAENSAAAKAFVDRWSKPSDPKNQPWPGAGLAVNQVPLPSGRILLDIRNGNTSEALSVAPEKNKGWISDDWMRGVITAGTSPWVNRTILDGASWASTDISTGEQQALNQFSRFGQMEEATTNLQRIPAARVRGLVRDHLAQESDGYVYIADIGGDGKHTFRTILEPYHLASAPRGFSQSQEEVRSLAQLASNPDWDPGPDVYYRVVSRHESPLGSWANVNQVLARMRSAESVRLNVEGYIDGKYSDAYQNVVGAVVFAYHVWPFGAALDNAAQHRYGEAAISLAGDAAMFLGFGAAAKGIGAAGRALRLTAAGIEGGIGATRATQGVFALRDGNNVEAAGYFGEATLRLLGMSATAILELKASRQAAETALEAEAGRVAPATRFATRPGGTGAAYNEATGQGVYVLRDSTGQIRYVGRGDAPARVAEHARLGSGNDDLVGEILFNNNLPANQARSLEQELMQALGGSRSTNPSTPLRNRIQGIAESNPDFLHLEFAADDALVIEAFRRAGLLRR